MVSIARAATVLCGGGLAGLPVEAALLGAGGAAD
jgi:hypothetical protein